ncbi:MAG: hypothetical protein RID91_12300 [Azospirillaceae bacterium]
MNAVTGNRATLFRLAAGASGLALLLAGCELAGIVAEAEPSFVSVGGPTGAVNDLDYKATTAVANLTVFPDADIVLRRAFSEAAVASPSAPQLPVDCTVDGTVATCEAVFPTAFDANQPVFDVDTTVFYQWVIAYGEAGGQVASDVRSFTIEAARSCAFDDVGPDLGAGDCSAERVCSSVTVQLLGTPGLETVPRCHVPAP